MQVPTPNSTPNEQSHNDSRSNPAVHSTSNSTNTTHSTSPQSFQQQVVSLPCTSHANAPCRAEQKQTKRRVLLTHSKRKKAQAYPEVHRPSTQARGPDVNMMHINVHTCIYIQWCDSIAISNMSQVSLQPLLTRLDDYHYLACSPASLLRPHYCRR